MQGVDLAQNTSRYSFLMFRNIFFFLKFFFFKFYFSDALYIKETTQEFWDLYTADEPQHSDVKMLPYPINVDEEGNVTALDAPWNCFPDTSASVLGGKSLLLGEKITT